LPSISANAPEDGFEDSKEGKQGGIKGEPQGRK